MAEDRTRTMRRIARTLVVAASLAAPHAASAADQPAASDWPIASKDFAGWRFADLGEITSANVGNLKVAFTFSTGLVRGHEAAPVVVGGTMYIVTPYPNIVYALDLMKPGASSRRIYDIYLEKLREIDLPPISFIGHGMGLHLHEDPYLGPTPDQPLEPGARRAIQISSHVKEDDLPLLVVASGPIYAERGLFRVSGRGLSQSMGIPLAVDVLIPDPLNS